MNVVGDKFYLTLCLVHVNFSPCQLGYKKSYGICDIASKLKL